MNCIFPLGKLVSANSQEFQTTKGHWNVRYWRKADIRLTGAK